jgi:crotonobetainyl-CoA:carnitine CoA-transferase CaiB-like acyl-CoA transferase
VALRRRFSVKARPSFDKAVTPNANFLSYPYGYIVDNRNKKGIALDIKTTEGREVFDRLIDQADVFITNMPIPTRERLNISYETLCAQNPSLVYASISAYG